MKTRRLRKKCDTLVHSIITEIEFATSANELEKLCYTCEYLIDTVIPLLLRDCTEPEELDKIKSNYMTKYRITRDFCINYKFS